MICVDASLAVKLLFEEEFTQQTDDLFTREAAGGEPVCAPALIRFEVTNVIRQRVRRGLLPSDEAPNYWDDFARIGLAVLSPFPYHRRAITLANQLNLPASYDAHYLALAEWLQCPFWTNDRRLVNSVSARLPFVRWIGDYQI